MSTGRSVYMPEPGRLEYVTHDLPTVGADGVLVRVSRANVCGSELHIWAGQHPVQKAILGHEMVGVVEQVGADRTCDADGATVAVGDRVTATYFTACGRCSACGRGDLHLCLNAYAYWMRDPDVWPHFHGTFGTHYYVNPGQWLYKVPDDIPDDEAAGANCGLSQVLYALDRGRLGWGDSFVIQGAGGLGLYALAIAKARGARVLVMDGVAVRRELALEFGADAVLDLDGDPADRAAGVLEWSGGSGADIVLEVTGVAAAVPEGMLFLRPGGRYVVIGNVAPGRTTPFDPAQMVRRSIEVQSTVRYPPWYLGRALRFLSETRDRFPYGRLSAATFPLDEVAAALDAAASRSAARPSIDCRT
jgi:threonine dehydrogenase-like Zn-dependent dehydrogenase